MMATLGIPLFRCLYADSALHGLDHVEAALSKVKRSRIVGPFPLAGVVGLSNCSCSRFHSSSGENVAELFLTRV